jgi:beta-lactamase class A
MLKIIRGLIITIVVSAPMHLHAQQDLLTRIINTTKQINGKVSVSVLHLEDGDTLSYNGNHYCIMDNVFKLPIAITLLNSIDKGKLSLDEKIFISLKEITADNWSPLRDKYPEGDIELPISDLLSYMIVSSDNVAGDILLKRIGGPKKVEDYMRNIGVKDIAMAASEIEINGAWNIQYTNWCTPNAMIKLLSLLYNKKILSKSNNALLLKMMENSTTGPNRIKGLLPVGTTVAHRTGTSGANKKGIITATNDIGIINTPNGEHIALSIFVNDAKEDEKTIDALIARIAKEVYDDAVRH